MKLFSYLLMIVFFVGCSSTRMMDSWANDEYTNYQPKKVLIVGITDNLLARKKFEERLKNEFLKVGINAAESYEVFKPSFAIAKQTEESIDEEVKRLSKEGFDAILISAVKGVDEKVSYSGDNYWTNNYWRRFGRYYYFDRGYYNKYKIYHIEASLYNITDNSDKSLVWVASYDIFDPSTINSTVDDYVKAIVKSLKKEGIIPESDN